MAGGLWTMLSLSRMLNDQSNKLIDQRLQRARGKRIDPKPALTERVNQLEDDLGRALLLIEMLADACLQKGVLTQEEFDQAARRVDMLDGVADGRVDPSVLRPPQAPQEPLTPREFLKKLEEEP